MVIFHLNEYLYVFRGKNKDKNVPVIAAYPKPSYGAPNSYQTPPLGGPPTKKPSYVGSKPSYGKPTDGSKPSYNKPNIWKPLYQYPVTKKPKPSRKPRKRLPFDFLGILEAKRQLIERKKKLLGLGTKSNKKRPGGKKPQPSYKPPNGHGKPTYEKPSYKPKPNYDKKPSYNNENDKPSYNDKLKYNDKPSYNDKPKYNGKPSYNNKQKYPNKPNYNKPSYNNKPNYRPKPDKPSYGLPNLNLFPRPSYKKPKKPSYQNKPNYKTTTTCPPGGHPKKTKPELSRDPPSNGVRFKDQHKRPNGHSKPLKHIEKPTHNKSKHPHPPYSANIHTDPSAHHRKPPKQGPPKPYGHPQPPKSLNTNGILNGPIQQLPTYNSNVPPKSTVHVKQTLPKNKFNGHQKPTGSFNNQHISNNVHFAGVKYSNGHQKPNVPLHQPNSFSRPPPRQYLPQAPQNIHQQPLPTYKGPHKQQKPQQLPTYKKPHHQATQATPSSNTYFPTLPPSEHIFTQPPKHHRPGPQNIVNGHPPPTHGIHHTANNNQQFNNFEEGANPEPSTTGDGWVPMPMAMVMEMFSLPQKSDPQEVYQPAPGPQHHEQSQSHRTESQKPSQFTGESGHKQQPTDPIDQTHSSPSDDSEYYPVDQEEVSDSDDEEYYPVDQSQDIGDHQPVKEDSDVYYPADEEPSHGNGVFNEEIQPVQIDIVEDVEHQETDQKTEGEQDEVILTGRFIV